MQILTEEEWGFVLDYEELTEARLFSLARYKNKI
jgi:hypothetical protein